MRDAGGTRIKVGDKVRFAEDRQNRFELGTVVAILDDEKVALSSPVFRTARGRSLIVDWKARAK